MTIEELINTYNIYPEMKDGAFTGRIGVKESARFIRDKMKETVTARKEEILDYFKEEHRRHEEEVKRKAEAIDSIEGLREIREAIAKKDTWRRKFNSSFDDVGGLGVEAYPDIDVESLKKRYPRANAYLIAEEKAASANYRISSIGKDAIDRILFGDYHEAIDIMMKELDEFATAHIWD